MIVKPANRIANIKSYYFARKLAEIEELNKNGGEPVLNLGIGSPDLQPPPAVLQSVTAALQEPTAHKYQSYRGLVNLREAFASWYQRHFSVSVDAATEVLPLIGSKEGIMHISMAFLNLGDEVLVPNPGYPAYKTVTEICGATPIFYNLSAENNWQPNFEEVEQLDLSKVKMMWVNYPHMPTGAAGSVALFQRLVDFGKKHNILICHDNPYSFILNEQPLSIMQAEGAKEVALELTSLSKHYNMAGWRIGALVGAADYVNTVLTFKSNMDSGMFRPLQEAAVQALNQDEQWHQSLNDVYKERRKAVWQIMDELDAVYDKDAVGMFVWAKVPAGKTGEQISDWCLHQARVFITPGFIFGSNGSEYIRISLCSPTKVFEQALQRIKRQSSK